MDVGARYYDAQVGRFITRDTVLSEHPYLYCEHDAVNAVDPSGHKLMWPVGWPAPPPGWSPPGGGHTGDGHGPPYWVGPTTEYGSAFLEGVGGMAAVVGQVGEGIGAINNIHEGYKLRDMFYRMRIESD